MRSSACEAAGEVVSPATRFAELPHRFPLKRGGILLRARLGYETWGRLAPGKNNAVLILSGLSASAHAASNSDDPSPGWWERMVGPGRPIDTDRWFVVCVNTLGSCFGSTGPASIDPSSARPYRVDYPELSIEDTAEAVAALACTLGIGQVACLVGASMGGMVALSLLARHPGFARSHVNISGAARATAFAIALRSIQRQAITSDPEWRDGSYISGSGVRGGMRLARMLGTLSYRSAEEWQSRFARRSGTARRSRGTEGAFDAGFDIEGYLQVQGDQFAESYDPNCYLYLSRAIDRFDLGDMAGGDLALALSQIVMERALVLGVETDLLFPVWQQEEIASGLQQGDVKTRMCRLSSIQGHDAFLIDFDSFGPPVAMFLEEL